MPDAAQAVYFDANVFIYAMEKDDDRGLLARRWLLQVERREIRAVTSELTFAEVLPHPLAGRDDELVDGYHRILQNRAILRVLPVRRGIVLRAADLRAEFNTDLPDAIHVATALQANCAAFLTEDTRVRLPPGLQKLALADARYPL
jgi:predicted nucleic acid-binding protein